MKYVHAFEANADHADAYLLKSLENKTEQQKRLEEILASVQETPNRIADIACGAGSLSYHLWKRYPDAEFTLVDLGEVATRHARNTMATFGIKGRVIKDEACRMSLADSHFELVFFWQTLLAIDDPRAAVSELIRICRPGGRIFLSSLFNTEHDVDLRIDAFDHTRSVAGPHPYNVYSARTVAEWVRHPHRFHACDMSIDIARNGRGLGTYTDRGFQLSAGIWMQWKILEIHKV
jgi:ubiquinone/menaquinone biosynthesis C-methylase UbiE